MTLKEGGLRGSLRNVGVDVGDIPDSGLYLDDWEDNNVTAARDDFSTTALDPKSLEPDSGETAFSDPVRTPWSQQQGDSFVATNDYMENPASGNHSAISANSKTGVEVWEFDITMTDSGSNIFFMFWPDSQNLSDFPDSESGYRILFDGSSMDLLRRDNGSDGGTIVSGSWPADNNTHTIRIERDSNGNWETFVNGNSQGTGTDTTYEGNNVGWLDHQASDAQFQFDNFRVF